MGQYTHNPMFWLTERNWLEEKDPFALFKVWFELAQQHEPEDPNAMALSTVDSQGFPNVRMVLLKDFSSKGFVIFTNSQSVKGQELLYAQKAAGVLHWKSLRRQIRFRGHVNMIDSGASDAYFSTRARSSQLGAWASLQSSPLERREQFEQRYAQFEQQFSGGDIPRPEYWCGFNIVPLEIEFWQDRPHRLHDRLKFSRMDLEGEWTTQMLYP